MRVRSDLKFDWIISLPNDDVLDVTEATRLDNAADLESIYLLDRLTGRYDRVAAPGPKKAGLSGRAVELQSGLWRKHALLCGLIADQTALWLRVGSSEVDLQDSNLDVRWSNTIPFVRTLEIWRGGERLVRHRLWAYFPLTNSAAGDFFEDVCALVGDDVGTLRCLSAWSVSDGRRHVHAADGQSGV
jgi:hypothetical protein